VKIKFTKNSYILNIRKIISTNKCEFVNYHTLPVILECGKTNYSLNIFNSVIAKVFETVKEQKPVAISRYLSSQKGC